MSVKPVLGRTTADAEGDVVVLLIGMRINHFWAVHQWLPVILSMYRMLGELARDRSRGLLGHIMLTASPRTYYVVQYWESQEKLYAYATSPDMFHHKVWAIINRKEREGRTHGHVGIWHEAYVVPEGSYESVYADMPAFGLAAAHGQVPVDRRGRHAKDRFAYRSAKAAGKAG
jgi:heme-degrading monooxygenase HmoA